MVILPKKIIGAIQIKLKNKFNKLPNLYRLKEEFGSLINWIKENHYV